MSSVQRLGLNSEAERNVLAQQVAKNWNKKAMITAVIIMLSILAFGAGLMLVCLSMTSRGVIPLYAGLTVAGGGVMSTLIITGVSCYLRDKEIERLKKL